MKRKENVAKTFVSLEVVWTNTSDSEERDELLEELWASGAHEINCLFTDTVCIYPSGRCFSCSDNPEGRDN